jgi:hypothetical protein
MEQRHIPPLSKAVPPRSAPTFHLIERQRPRPIAVLLAIVVAGSGLFSVAYGLNHSKAAKLARDNGDPGRSLNTPGGKAAEDKDDPSQVDTIVLGDAADAPVPASKAGRSTGPTNVHATVLIRLPRYGTQSGLIPDSPAGHLLYQWLAAFNQASLPALGHVLPNADSSATAAAQYALRQQTGGFYLMSAKEIQPGLLVFRMHDQTPDTNEVLGTLLMRPGSNPATIASFSLRAIPQTHPKATAPAAK